MACRTSGMENGLSCPGGAGAGLRMSDSWSPGRDELDPGRVPELLGGLGAQTVQVQVHVAGLELQRRPVHEERT